MLPKQTSGAARLVLGHPTRVHPSELSHLCSGDLPHCSARVSAGLPSDGAFPFPSPGIEIPTPPPVKQRFTTNHIPSPFRKFILGFALERFSKEISEKREKKGLYYYKQLAIRW